MHRREPRPCRPAPALRSVAAAEIGRKPGTSETGVHLSTPPWVDGGLAWRSLSSLRAGLHVQVLPTFVVPELAGEAIVCKLDELLEF